MAIFGSVYNEDYTGITGITVISTNLHASSATLGQSSGELPISRDVALELISSGNTDLSSLLTAARAAKERFKPHTITYSRKVFIPLTNLCRDYCG